MLLKMSCLFLWFSKLQQFFKTYLQLEKKGWVKINVRNEILLRILIENLIKYITIKMVLVFTNSRETQFLNFWRQTKLRRKICYIKRAFWELLAQYPETHSIRQNICHHILHGLVNIFVCPTHVTQHFKVRRLCTVPSFIFRIS